MKVGILISNNSNGLHKGHKELINFGKQFGDVTVYVIENMSMRNKYLLRGQGTDKYKVNLTKMQEGCNELGVSLKLQPYISISEQARLLYYEKARTFVEGYRKNLISQRYIQMAICSVMIGMIYTQSNQSISYNESNIMVAGPDVLSFFYKFIAQICGWSDRKIFKQIIKDEYGLKESSSFYETPISYDKDKLRRIVDSVRWRYEIGDNNKWVREINEKYATENFRVSEVLVYEDGFVEGRIEVTAFSFVTPVGLKIVEEVDYEDY